MSWRSHALIAAFCAGLAALALAGCGFQPLYGGTTAGGAKLVEVMKAVDITPIPGRVGQKLRNELIFATTGGGDPASDALQARHRHQGERDRPAGADHRRRDRADLPARRHVQAGRFRQRQSACCKARAIARAPYNRFQEIFANIRARYDAENRAARTVAESIRTQLAAFLANAA